MPAPDGLLDTIAFADFEQVAGAIIFQRLGDFPGTDFCHGIAMFRISLTGACFNLGGAKPARQCPENATGLDRLKLPLVSNQNNFCSRKRRHIKQALHLTRTRHSGFVQNDFVQNDNVPAR